MCNLMDDDCGSEKSSNNGAEENAITQSSTTALPPSMSQTQQQISSGQHLAAQQLAAQQLAAQQLAAQQLARIGRLPTNYNLTATSLLVENALARQRINQEINRAVLTARLNSLSAPLRSVSNTVNPLSAFDLQRSLQATQRNIGIRPASVAARPVPLGVFQNPQMASTLENIGSLPATAPQSFASRLIPSRIEARSEKPVGTFEQSLTVRKEDSIAKRMDKISPAPLPLPSTKGEKGRVIFPQILHKLLRDLENQPSGSKIASFLPHGRSFIIHKHKEFERYVMPQYFDMTTFSSFRRQLNLYNFEQVKIGPDQGAYFHKDFLRQKPDLCVKIKRSKKTKVSKADPDGKDDSMQSVESGDKKPPPQKDKTK